MKKILNLILVFIMLAFSSQSAVAGEYAVVVNANNSFSGDAKSEVKNLFLKKKTAWEGGLAAKPFSRSSDSAEQQAFNVSILGMSSTNIESYWQSEKQKTGATPPKTVGSEGILFRQIKRKDGAFGVVSGSSAAQLPDGLKVLLKFSD